MMALKQSAADNLKDRKEEDEAGVEKRRKWLAAWEGMVDRVVKGVKEMLDEDEVEGVEKKLDGLKM